MPVEGYKASVVIKEKESHEEAVREAMRFKNCPRLLAYGLDGNRVISFFMAPDDHEWWINFSELFPDSKSQTLMIDEVYYPFKPREVEFSEKPPCGADCSGCPQVEINGCEGCIATRVGR